MASIEKKSLNRPDDVQKPAEKVKVDVVGAGGLTFQRVTAQPGWRWSIDLKPVQKTESCQKHHLLYMISGTLRAPHERRSGGGVCTRGHRSDTSRP